MTAHSPAAVLVLAAGEGTRMRSATPKVLHTLAGRTLVGHVVAAARELEPGDLVVVVGHGRDAVTAHLADLDPRIRTAVQEPQNGTGHAARIALEQLPAVEGTVVVVYGDTPLLTGATLQHLASAHAAEGNAATVLTAVLADPHGYGRVRRDADGAVAAIVEQRDADEAQLAITEINSGMYAFDAALLRSALGRLTTDNAQGEEYLTDVLAMLRADGHRVGAVVAADPEEVLGVNDRVQLAHARRVLRDRILDTWMRAGVTVVDPATTWVDVDVTLEPDAVLHQDTRLHGRTHVAAGAQVGPGCTLRRHDRRRGRRGPPRLVRKDRDRPARDRRPLHLPPPGHLGWVRARRPARTSRSRTPGWVRARRSRTCPTWGTPRSARAPTSVRRRCS